ncbi:MAG: hypothetical protein ACP5H3_03990 [Candidatus Aenigmatarchaeota archaeon]
MAELQKIIKVPLTKKEIEDKLNKISELTYNGKYFYYTDTIEDDAGYITGDFTIAIYPFNHKIVLKIDTEDFERGQKQQAKEELDSYAMFLKDSLK